METFHHSKSNDLRWLLILGAVSGTFLLAFVPSDAWMHAEEPSVELLARLVKAVLTVLLLTVVPALWARVAQTVSVGMLIALGALAFGCGFLFSGNGKGALYTLLLIALPGAGLYLLQRLKISNFRTVVYGSFLILIALFGYRCLPGMIENGDGFGWFREAVGLVRKSLEPFDVMEYKITGFTLGEILDTYRDSAEEACVPMMLSASMAASLSNTLLSHLWNRNGSVALTPLPKFEDWRCERWYVILTTVFVFGSVLLSLFGWRAIDGVASVAEELWRLPCMLAGLCAIRKIGTRSGRGWILWIAIGALLILPAITGIILTGIGILASVRKPMNTGENGGHL